jgi:phage gpG-like protein
MELQFAVLGDQQLKRTIIRFAEEVSDCTEPLKEVTQDFWQMEQRQFDSGGNASGGWASLKPNYAKWKARHFPNAKILELTGLLKGSLTNQNPWTVNELEKLKVTLGTKINYAGYHQTGTRNMPQRRPIDFTEQDKKRWNHIFAVWLKARQASIVSMADIQGEAESGFAHAMRTESM